jgi:quercetin dioxygenase-like cupin family protein
VTAPPPESLAWDDVPVERPLPGVLRQTIQGAAQTIVRYRYAPGAHFPVHRHPQEQITIVLAGAIVFQIDGARRELVAGQIAVIPSDTPHGADVEGDAWVDTLNCLSPRREASPSF